MKNTLLLFILFTGLVSWGQRVNIDELTVSNNTYSLNGSSYNGSVYGLYDSGQLKEEFQVKNGRIEGDKIIYHQDNSFRKERYKDTTLITQIESNLSTLNDELSSLEKDSSTYNRRKRSLKSEMGDKFYKYKEKYNEGKLKGNKLELYEDYLYATKKLDEKTLDVGEKRIERNKVEKTLNTEKGKSEYSHKKKDVYQYSNGLCSLHKEYDKYEKLLLEEELKDGLRNGSYKRYESGTVKEDGTYLNNKKNGLWTLYSYNGKEEITYSIDVKNGDYKKYNGEVVVTEGQYSNGLMIGEWIYRWDNGNLKGQGKYIDGDGVLNDFQKTTECKYPFPFNGRDGLWLNYYESGIVRDSVNWTNGNMDGIEKLFYENGQLWVYRNWKVVEGKSKQNEYSVGYDEDGNKTFEDVQVDDNKWTSTWFYPNGNKKYEYYSVNGKSNGEEKWYYESGEIQFRFFHKEGKRDKTKKTTRYYKNGNIWYEGIAGDGETEWYGEFKKYHENGNLMEISNYDMSGNGRILSTKKYDSNGKEIIQKSTIEFWNTEENKEVLLNHIIEDVDWHSPRSVEPVKYCFVKEKDFMGRYSRGYEITFLIIIDAQNAFGTYKRSSNWFSIYKNGDGTYKFSSVTHNEDERGYRGIITFPDEREVKNKLREF